MSEKPDPIEFDHYSPLAYSPARRFVYSDAAVVQLDELPSAPPQERHSEQKKGLAGITLALPADKVFDQTLNWSFRGYEVLPQSAPSQVIAAVQPPSGTLAVAVPIGSEPEQHIDVNARKQQFSAFAAQAAQLSAQGAAAIQPRPQRLCLFNVLVAFEWRPTAAYMQELRWAFRRASDFLYDVTEGYMAFGQVWFGGPKLMDGADIQIMASNRLLPRSWVNGLHDPNKYMPIRAGRGLWHKNSRFSIAWDEPEAYRTLIHEWGHYALGLKDAYLDAIQVVPASTVPTSTAADQIFIDILDLPKDLRQARKDQAQQAKLLYTLVVPQISVPLDSIMATLEGTSELFPHIKPRDLLTGAPIHQSSADRKRDEWDELAKKAEFLFLDLISDPHERILSGPGQLPLPLPRFQDIFDNTTDATTPASDDLRLLVPAQFASSHAWIYVIKGSLDNPTQLIAQGTLDERTADDGFQLLGASPNDFVVLIDDGDKQNKSTASVYYRIIGKDRDPSAQDIATWTSATPSSFPIIDVLPIALSSTNARSAEISVRITPASNPTVWIFPLGMDTSNIAITRHQVQSPTERIPVTTLDGHVLMTWLEDGELKLMIAAYSQGGGPKTTFPLPTNPVAAGSSEGNAMLFFDDSNDKDGSGSVDYSHIRVVTTVLHGRPTALGSAAMQQLYEPRSYTFSLASTAALPRHLNPTLVLFFDRATDIGDGHLLVHRYYQSATQEWTPIASYAPPGSFFVAAPLNSITAPGLFDKNNLQPERFRLLLVPRAPTPSGEGL